MDEFDPNNLPAAEAIRRVTENIEPIAGVERVAIRDALDRVLAEDVLSPVDVPPHRNSAMDGYALAGSDLSAEGRAELKVIGSSFAGAPFDGTVQSGQAVRIMTGAVVPEGADTVIMQEHTERDGDTVRIQTPEKTGANVRMPGEDIAKGGVVIAAGKRVRPAELGLLASLGVPEVSVRRRLRVAFFSTGDELASVGEPLAEGQIYDSNRYTLFGMLHRMGCEVIDMGVIRDRRDDVRRAFRDASSIADAVITSGGVSVGEADFVKETLDEMGEVTFWKIAIKPGKPLAFGHIGKARFFGLPGNPVSAMATFYQFVQPSLRMLAGEARPVPNRFRVPLTGRLKKRPGRLEYQRGILETGADGTMRVRSTGPQGSHILSSMSQANCFIILPLESSGVEEGELVTVEPFEGLV
jgi:molybdopterin molybdotransferase